MVQRDRDLTLNAVVCVDTDHKFYRDAQLTVRALLGAMFIVGIVLAPAVNRHRQEHIAIERIRALGGTVRMEPRFPSWLSSRLGPATSYTAVEVELTAVHADSASVDLGQLPNLRTLHLAVRSPWDANLEARWQRLFPTIAVKTWSLH